MKWLVVAFIVITIGWTPNDDSEEVIYYTVTVDDLSSMMVGAGSCQPDICLADLIVTQDKHTISVTASNSVGTSAPTTIQVSNGDLHRK